MCRSEHTSQNHSICDIFGDSGGISYSPTGKDSKKIFPDDYRGRPARAHNWEAEGALHISVIARRKEELIAELIEAGGVEKLDPSSAASGPSSADLMELILTMERQQMEGQQKRQEEWILLQQASQREMREQQEKRRVAAEEARRRAKLPKPVLQKFAEKDDMESYHDTFELVAAQQEWP